ncbi:MAG: hypothetical protein IMY67_04980 [Bacteroidetes bacterium]|nr:hypothetical protein [Bacteroidota bacterium]
MRFLKSIFDFYLNSSIHVALAVCGFVGITLLEFDFSISNNLLGFIFFGTITGYNFVKYAEVARLKHRSLNLSLRTIQIFSFFSFLALSYFALKLTIQTLFVTGLFAALTFFYAIPVLQNKNLRTLTGIKILIVAIVWAGVTLIIPIVNENEILNRIVWMSFFQRVLFVFVLTLPFEIRDLQYDELALGTLPQKAGIKKTKVIGVVLLMVTIIIEFLKPELNWDYAISLMLISGVLTLFLFISEKNQSKYFASFWTESIPIVWYGLLLLFQLI